MPDDRTLVLERFRDELGDWRVVLHSPYGARVHAPWALAIAARLRERYGGMDVQALHTDDGIIIRVPDSDEPPPAGVALLDRTRRRDHHRRGRRQRAVRVPVPRVRGPGAAAAAAAAGAAHPALAAAPAPAQLLEVAAQFPGFPITLETVRECLQDVFDVPALTSCSRPGRPPVRLVEVETATPSPFARRLLFGYVGAFMYEGDAPLAERRAQALALDPKLLAELLGTEELRELLDPAVVRRPRPSSSTCPSGRRSRDAEGVADLLRTSGPLTGREVAAPVRRRAAPTGWPRCGGPAISRCGWPGRSAGRRPRTRPERDALGAPLPAGVPAAFLAARAPWPPCPRAAPARTGRSLPRALRPRKAAGAAAGAGAAGAARCGERGASCSKASFSSWRQRLRVVRPRTCCG